MGKIYREDDRIHDESSEDDRIHYEFSDFYLLYLTLDAHLAFRH